jgi:hypothetical protein
LNQCEKCPPFTKYNQYPIPHCEIFDYIRIRDNPTIIIYDIKSLKELYLTQNFFINTTKFNLQHIKSDNVIFFISYFKNYELKNENGSAFIQIKDMRNIEKSYKLGGQINSINFLSYNTTKGGLYITYAPGEYCIFNLKKHFQVKLIIECEAGREDTIPTLIETRQGKMIYLF